MYIGQTNNLERRMQEHKHDRRENKPLQNAISKYGFENFKIDILYYGEDYSEEERKWIQNYKSIDKKYGYNIREGGQDSAGEDNPMSTISQKTADAVMFYLITTELMYKEISDLTGASTRVIQHINAGSAWRKEELIYPLQTLKGLPEYIINRVIELLKDTTMKFQDVADSVEIPSHYITRINTGMIYARDGVEYPIRKNNKLDDKTIGKIVHLLKTTKSYFKDIAKETETTISIVNNINRGKSYKNDTEEYPLRKTPNSNKTRDYSNTLRDEKGRLKSE